MIKILVI